ncbi:AMP-binding protein [Saccharomonospora sp. NPDC046836]|uniref:AMP-binding protein n=1 Tax=Saccharomonospora sp. NPDC046836 TaxID=3156921 RepID=UPI0033DCAEB4
MTLDVAPPEVAQPAALGVPFAQGLARYGDRLAMVGPDGTAITYAELADRVAATAQRLGTVRRLVLVAATNDVEPLVTYLAALAAGHPVLVTAADEGGRLDSLIAAYDPDVVLRQQGRTWRLTERRAGTRHRLHPELALLLSTSGSTGSPKLVRLSRDNLQSNATAIADYLGIRGTDRVLTSLPLHYCYGLSVVNSNLLSGAALLLTADSVVEDAFWELARRWRATSLHGVPHTFELLEAVGRELDLPSLRYVTQAGGRLDPARVRDLTARAARQGWRLFVMYGQTEATARMAYLPPELAATYPGAIGVPIPGGSFELDDDGSGEGELIYRGPNVMLGYAESPADLALGRSVHALATGDIARRTDAGLYEIVGRRNRFLKLFGLRVDLGQVERLLAEHGYTAACSGDDEGLVVAVTRDAGGARALVCERVGLPPDRVHVTASADLPRLASGKVDYTRIRRAPSTLREAFGRVLGHTGIDGDATFVSLGGDSLTYVRMSMELQKLLGAVPDRWPTMTVRELERLTPRRRLLRTVETGVVLWAVAILLVVGTHIALFDIRGGAHLLLILAGWSFARFGLAQAQHDKAGSRVLRGAARIAVPSVLWLAYRAVTEGDVVLPNVLLISNYAPGAVARGYWFIEVLVQTLLVFGLLFCIPALRRFERAHAFGLPLATLGGALVLNLALDGVGQAFDNAMSTHGALWFFVLGWLAQRAATRPQAWLVAALALLLVPGYFGSQVREAVVIGGLVLLLAVPRLALPAPLARLAGVVASASLAIYLTHYAVYPELLPHLSPLTVLLVSVVSGIGAWLIADRGVRAARTLL